MSFEFREETLAEMFALASLDVPKDEMIFFALRGATPIDDRGTGFAKAHALEHLRVDYRHMNCTFGQWLPGVGIAVFPGSTVPHVDAISSHIGAGGRGVNQLALGYYRDGHRYVKGDHQLSKPMARHRAFRNESLLPVWRTGDDTDYEGDDYLGYETVVDNLHCAWQLNVASPSYSSNGCQVVAGMPRVEARGWENERGPWARFVAQAYELEQKRFCYALFTGQEAVKTATLGAGERAKTVRFGSKGPLVKAVQEALLARGYDVGSAGADGDCGFTTIAAIKRFQATHLGKQNTDLVVGPSTARELGLDWSNMTGAAPAGTFAASAAGASTPAADETPGTPNAKYGVTFRSLVPGGFYSSDPDDMNVKRAIRSNNPGALNITQWQREFTGYVGVTKADRAGNVTTIYETPEHGVAAWFYLLTNRYGYGTSGKVRVGELARRYAGVSSETAPSSLAYVAGWRRASGGTLDATTVIDLANETDVLKLARAMFIHEIGGPSPLKDEQIVYGVRLLSADGEVS